MITGVDGVHEGTTLVKSVLLVGPRGCGKSQLVQAVAYEAGATLMDLTATNIVGRYPGRAGLNMLTHLVMKVRLIMAVSPHQLPLNFIIFPIIDIRANF